MTLFNRITTPVRYFGNSSESVDMGAILDNYFTINPILRSGFRRPYIEHVLRMALHYTGYVMHVFIDRTTMKQGYIVADKSVAPTEAHLIEMLVPHEKELQKWVR